MFIALVVQIGRTPRCQRGGRGFKPRPTHCVAVITQPAECQSSKLERWVRIPLTALQTHAVIAQRAEQPPRKRQVAGSIPARGLNS